MEAMTPEPRVSEERGPSCGEIESIRVWIDGMVLARGDVPDIKIQVSQQLLTALTERTEALRKCVEALSKASTNAESYHQAEIHAAIAEARRFVGGK